MAFGNEHYLRHEKHTVELVSIKYIEHEMGKARTFLSKYAHIGVAKDVLATVTRDLAALNARHGLVLRNLRDNRCQMNSFDKFVVKRDSRKKAAKSGNNDVRSVEGSARSGPEPVIASGPNFAPAIPGSGPGPRAPTATEVTLQTWKPLRPHTFKVPSDFVLADSLVERVLQGL